MQMVICVLGYPAPPKRPYISLDCQSSMLQSGRAVIRLASSNMQGGCYVMGTLKI